MINFSRREKYIFILAVAVVISAFSYNFIFGPWLDKYDDISRHISLEKARLERGVRLLENGDEILKKYDYYASSFKGISWILSYIETQAAASEIKTTNITPSPLLQNDMKKEYEIDLQIEGEVKHLQNFISNLTGPPMKMGLKRFDFRSHPKDSDYLIGTIVLSKIVL